MPPSKSPARREAVTFSDATDIMRNVLYIDLICRRILHTPLPTDILYQIFIKTRKEERKIKKKKELPQNPDSGAIQLRERGARRKRSKTKVKIKRAVRYHGR